MSKKNMSLNVWKIIWPLVLATCEKQRFLLVAVVYSNNSTSSYVQVLRQMFPSKTRISHHTVLSNAKA